MAYDCSLEEERLQKKLVPLNIVVCIICLVAAISILFTPFIKIDMRKLDNESIKEATGVDVEATLNESGFDFELEVIIEQIGGEISITPIDVAKFAFSEENVVKLVIKEVGPAISTIIEGMLIPMTNGFILSELEIDAEGVDLSTLNDKFKALGDAKSEDEFKGAAGDWIDELAKLGETTIDPEEKSAILDEFAVYYNKTIAATGGEFDLEKLICVIASESVELEEPVTSYTDFIITMVDASGSGEGEGEEGAENPSSALDEMDDAIKLLAKSFFWFMAFVAGLWMILFLFSLFHIFATNKRFMMWYVKMFGFLPCLIFGVTPLAVQQALPLMGTEAAAMAPLLGAITSLTWISGACYVLLWLISIFWAFPIKRKIRADRKS